MPRETYMKAHKLTHCANGNTVETWYDRRARNWVTQTWLNFGTPQQREFEHSDVYGNRDGVKAYHEERVKLNGGKKK